MLVWQWRYNSVSGGDDDAGGGGGGEEEEEEEESPPRWVSESCPHSTLLLQLPRVIKCGVASGYQWLETECVAERGEVEVVREVRGEEVRQVCLRSELPVDICGQGK